jgi:hypothetical protein
MKRWSQTVRTRFFHPVLLTLDCADILYLLGRLMRQSPNKELLPLESLFPLLRAVLDDNDVSLNVCCGSQRSLQSVLYSLDSS